MWNKFVLFFAANQRASSHVTLNFTLLLSDCNLHSIGEMLNLIQLALLLANYFYFTYFRKILFKHLINDFFQR